MLCATMLGAGTDTTRNQLAAAVQALAAHPAQWDLLARHPELATDAVHELIRYSPIVFGTIRQAAEDVELAGVSIPAGTIHLARLELTEALRVITARMPNPRVTGPAHRPAMSGITGPLSVPLEFDPGH